MLRTRGFCEKEGIHGANGIWLSRSVGSAVVILTTSGDDGARTHDPRLAKPVLFQLSYVPEMIDSTVAAFTFPGFVDVGALSGSRPCAAAI